MIIDTNTVGPNIKYWHCYLHPHTLVSPILSVSLCVQLIQLNSLFFPNEHYVHTAGYLDVFIALVFIIKIVARNT